jgi:hypothetical protein
MKATPEVIAAMKPTKNGNYRLGPTQTFVLVKSCLVCGEPFFALKQFVDKGRKVFCSPPCGQIGKNHSAPKGEESKIFGKPRPDMKKRMTGSSNPMYGIGNKHPMYGRRGPLSPAYREKNINWKGGVSPLREKIRRSPEYEEWRKAVFERDHYTCQECGKMGGSLHAHHKKSFADYPELRFDISNGLTLCRECHYKGGVHDMFSKKEQEWFGHMVEKTIKEALTIKVRFEKRRDEKTGQPLATPQIDIKDVYIPDFIVEYLPYTEGALRGMQEQVCQVGNTVTRDSEIIKAAAGALLNVEGAMKRIVAVGEGLKVVGAGGPRVIEALPANRSGDHEDQDHEDNQGKFH